MATPIPYTIKKGDSLSKIAGNLGIDDWHKLRTYHNNNCQPISEQIGEQLKEGKTLLTPSQDEIDMMNGKSREVIEEKKEEEKEIEAHEEDKEKEKQKEAEKGEHDDKYFVVHGAKCFCDQSEVPKKLADLQVTSHSKVVYNDEEGKYAATEEDKTFLPPAVTFGNCKLKPNGSGGYLPCSVAPAPKWDKPYDKTKILGKKVLTEISELKCTVGGKIAIEKHGQTDSVLTQHAENTNALELAMTNPALKIPPKKSEIPNVTQIVAKKIENHPDFKEKASNEEKGIEKIIARPHEEITFEAKVKTGNKKLVSWLVYEGHEGKKEQRIFMREQIGHEFKNSFEAGKYRVEGYGSPKEAGNDKNYASISLDIEVTNNKLSGSSLTPAAKDFAIDENGKHKLRKGFPAKFKAEFLIPPTAEELGKLKIYLTDESGNILDNGIQALNSFVFTPKNSTAKYNIVAEYIDTEGNLSVQTFSGETASNSVLGISHSDEIVRPLSNLQFSVTKTKFNVLVKSDADLTIPELSEIKWNLNGQLIGTGRTIAVPGILLAKPGDYVIEAFAISSNGFGRNAKKENDDWHFKVSENDVVSFTQNTIPKVGKWITLTADKFVFQNLLPNEKVNWHIEGGDKLADSMAIQFKPATAGIKNISCKINSQKGIRQSIEIKQAAINDVMFTDSNGLKIEKASWGQKINIWIDQKELTGEKLEIQLRDSDAFDDDDVAPLLTIPAYDGKLIPITLDKNIKGKAGKHGELYVKVTAPEIIAINEGEKLGKVDVQDIKEIYSAQIGSEDGKEKHTVVDYDEISWFYAHTRGIKTNENLYLEIRDSVFGKDPLLLIGKNIKVDESGVIKVKINWALIKNKASFLTVYAIVKENNADGKVLYDADGSFSMATAKLMKSSSLVKEAGYKSAVMVEGVTIKKEKDDDKVCECEARVRAFMRMLRVGEGTGELNKSGNKIDPQLGYTTAFGGNKITDLSRHPMKVYGWSSAAGAYQIMQYTYAWLGGSKLEWTGKYFKILDIYEAEHDYRKTYKINDYRPESQDKLCICLMKDKKGFIELIIKNQIEDAIRKYGSAIWASLPYEGDNSRYKDNEGHLQPATPMKTCMEHYNLFLKEELNGVSNLHLKNGFLKEFNYKCCNEKIIQGEICKECKQYHYNVSNSKNWVHQKPSECWQASVNILAKYGLKNNSGYPQNRIIMADQTEKTLIPKNTQMALDYLDEQLKLGNPIVVGLDDNLRKATYNSHKATEHFFVIVGKGCEDGKIYYSFFDVGSKTVEEGTAEKNKLYLLENKLLEGKSYGGTHNYTVTEVRRNK